MVPLLWLRLCFDRDNVASTEQRTTTKMGIKTIRPYDSLLCDQVRCRFYAIDSLSSNDCVIRTGHLWGGLQSFHEGLGGSAQGRIVDSWRAESVEDHGFPLMSDDLVLTGTGHLIKKGMGICRALRGYRSLKGRQRLGILSNRAA